MLRRCNFNMNQVNYIKSLCEGTSEYIVVPGASHEMVNTLWASYEKSGFLSTRIFDYLDTETITLVDTDVILAMLNTMPKKPFPVMTVHDCFRCHPNYGNDLRRQYNQILSDIAKSDLLGFILSQVLGQEFSAGKLDDSLWQDILETDYALS